MGGDVEFLLGVLLDRQEHELGEILQRSIADRGHGLTVHSRAADLRKRGYKVKNRTKRLESGRRASYYQLLREPELDEASASSASLAAGASSSPGLEEASAAERLGPDGADVSSSPGLRRIAEDLPLARDPEAEVLPDAPPGGPPDAAEPGEQLSLLEAA